jgi:O-antigen ligase
VDLNQWPLLLLFGWFLFAAVPKYRRVFNSMRADPVLLAVMVLAIVSAVWSTDPIRSIARGLVLVASYVTAAYVAAELDLRSIWIVGVVAVGVAGLVSAALAVALPSIGVMQDLHYGAWKGIYVQKNSLARAMALGVVLSLPLAVGGPLHGRRLVRVGAALLCAIVLVMAQSAAGIVASISGLALIAALPALRRPGLTGLGATTVVAVFGVMVGLVVVANVNAVLELLGRDATLSGRVVMWSLALEMSQDRPLLGFGYGGFWTDWSGPSGEVWSSVGWMPTDAHNGLIDLLLELGWLGALAMSIHLLSTGLVSFRLLKRREPGTALPFILLVFFVMYNVIENVTLRPTNMYWMLYMMISMKARMELRGTPGHERTAS